MSHHKEIDSKIASLLKAAPRLRDSWVKPPSVMHIPFMKSRESFFLLISILISPERTDREFLLEECMSVAGVAIESGLLKSEKAVEVNAYIPEPKKPKRVIRFSVNNGAFDRLRSIRADKLQDSAQPDGVKWSWPLS